LFLARLGVLSGKTFSIVEGPLSDGRTGGHPSSRQIARKLSPPARRRQTFTADTAAKTWRSSQSDQALSKEPSITGQIVCYLNRTYRVLPTLAAIIDRTGIIGDARAHVVPALIAAAGERASLRFLEFFAANIRSPHTRRTYSRAVSEFMTWCEDNGVTSIAAVQPLHVSAWIEQQTREHAAPIAKLRLAALRYLFDWLVTGQVMPANPAGSVRGPSHIVKAGKTPVLVSMAA
jgi:hypothetical protein